MKAKRYLKQGIATLMSLLSKPSKGRALILCYHSVHPSIPFSSATPELFEEHLRWLSQHASLVSFSSIFRIVRETSCHDDKPALAITFDDGYADNYDYAFPLLRKYGIPATFFITVGLVEKDPAVLKRFLLLRQCSPEDMRCLTWDQVREMRQAGMEIGCHTYTHPNLLRLDRLEVEKELRKSKEIIEAQLGEPVTLLAYPFGKYRRHFSDTTIALARQAGYQYGAAVAFRAVNHDDSPLALPRFFVTRDSIETLAQKIGGAWDWLGWWQERAPLWLARRISCKDFEV